MTKMLYLFRIISCLSLTLVFTSAGCLNTDLNYMKGGRLYRENEKKNVSPIQNPTYDMTSENISHTTLPSANTDNTVFQMIWLNNSVEEFILPSKQLLMVLNHAKNLKKIEIWYDSNMVKDPCTAEERMNEYIQNEINTLSGQCEFTSPYITFKNIRHLAIINTNEQMFNSLKFFIKIDLLKIWIGIEAFEDSDIKYAVYADFDVPSNLDYNTLFNETTQAMLGNHGMVLCKENKFGLRLYENGFHILYNCKEVNNALSSTFVNSFSRFNYVAEVYNAWTTAFRFIWCLKGYLIFKNFDDTLPIPDQCSSLFLSKNYGLRRSFQGDVSNFTICRNSKSNNLPILRHNKFEIPVKDVKIPTSKMDWDNRFSS